MLHCDQYIYLLGNHDFYKPDDKKYHAVKDWKNIDNLLIVDNTTVYGDIVFVPYHHNIEEFPKDIGRLGNILVAHQTFIGADYGYLRPDAGVNADEIDVDIIISGHVHLRQEFGKVVYPGTPFSQSVNDIDQTKGILLFDTETYEKTFIECPLPSWRGMRYEVSSNFTINDIHSDISASINDKDHWIVEITGPKAEIVAYQNSKEYKSLLKQADIRVKPKFIDKEKKKVKIEGLSMEHVVDEYWSKIYKGSESKAVLVDKSLEILKKVRESKQKSKM